MGPLLCLISAACFGAMAIFGKLAYDDGVTVGALLLVRFALAATLLMAVAWRTGVLRGLSRRAVLVGLGMGAIGYAAQSGLFFAALERMDASLLALILYTYPALVLAGAASGAVDPVGALMGFGASLVYTAYILIGDRIAAGIPLVALVALVCTGATGTFAVAAAIQGGPELGFAAAGWGWLGCIALVSTVGAILAFFAGLVRVGPSAASILSTLEPVVTVALAAAAFGESLAAVQLLGGALVLSAVVVMQWPERRAVARHASAASW